MDVYWERRGWSQHLRTCEWVGEWMMPALRDMGVDVDWMGVGGGGGA